MRFTAPLLVLVLCSSVSIRAPRAQQVSVTAPAPFCGPIGVAQTRTTLYLGLNRRTGSVTEAQWAAFLRDEVTPRFPQGLTVWQADGQWRRADGTIAQERSKVLLLVHDESSAAHSALTAIIESYKHRFEQESVLWETARVCAAF